MRKLIVIGIALLAFMAVIAPQAQAQSTPQGAKWQSSVDSTTWLDSQAAQLKATGFTLLAGQHNHQVIANSPRWFRQSTGRYYYFRVTIGIHHEYNNAPTFDRWQPFFTVECRREYPQTGDDVLNACNFELDQFRALRFQSAGGLSIDIPGTSNPSNDQCKLAESENGAWRTASETWSWVGAELNYIRVRFLTDLTNCTGLHLTDNVYQIRSYRTNICGCGNVGDIDYEESFADSKFGLRTV